MAQRRALKSERGIMRYVRKHLRHLFPTLLTQSAFNRRLRRLWGAFLLIQDAVAEALTALHEILLVTVFGLYCFAMFIRSD